MTHILQLLMQLLVYLGFAGQDAFAVPWFDNFEVPRSRDLVGT